MPSQLAPCKHTQAHARTHVCLLLLINIVIVPKEAKLLSSLSFSLSPLESHSVICIHSYIPKQRTPATFPSDHYGGLDSTCVVVTQLQVIWGSFRMSSACTNQTARCLQPGNPRGHLFLYLANLSHMYICCILDTEQWLRTGMWSQTAGLSQSLGVAQTDWIISASVVLYVNWANDSTSYQDGVSAVE